MMKRFLFAIACLLAMGGTITSQAQNLNHAYGDVNLDGEITVADVNAVINIILGGNGNLNTADVNNDGEVTIADINIIIDLILHPTRIPEDVHVYGDTPGSEGSVWLVTDETVVVSCPPGQEPEVGDIIVSGVTEYAPYGFLRRVESVERSRGQCVMTTTNASLEEVLPDGDYHIDIPLVLPGQQSTFNSEADAPSRVKFSTDFKGTIKIGFKGDVPDIKFDVWPFMTPEQEKKKEDEVLNGEVDSSYPLQFIAKMSPSLNLVFDCSVKHRKLQHVELGGELEVKAELLLKATLEKEFKRVGENGLILPGSIDMAPITVMAGPVPVVFTPKLHFSLGVDLKGELYMQFKLMSATASGSFSYVYTREPDPVTGQKHNFYKNFETSTLGDGDMAKRFQKWLAPKVGVSGSAKGILTPMPDVSVYNANDIFHVSVPLSPWVKVGGNLSITLDPSNSPELDFEDIVTLTGGADIGIAAVFNLFGKKEVWEKDFTLFETELMAPFALTPRFDELRVTPDEDPIPATTPAIEFGTYMTKPNIQVLPDQDYGFAYGPKDELNRTATWTHVSLKEQYDPEFDGDVYKHQYIQAAIDPAFVEPGVPYRVSPYVQLFGKNIYKKGKDFTLDGATPCVTVSVAEVDFGDVLIGFSPTQLLEINNSSSIPQTVTVKVTPPFSIAQNESSMSNITVEIPGNSCTPVTIMFTALQEDDYLGTATFTSNAIEGGSCVIPLHGRGVTEEPETPILLVTPTELDFGVVDLGTDKTETLTLTNTGTGTLKFMVSGDSGFRRFFEVSESDVEHSLAPGASMNYTVTSHGMATSYEANTDLVITSSADSGIQRVKLHAIGNDTEPLVAESEVSIQVGETKILEVKTNSYEIFTGNEQIVKAEQGGGTTEGQGGDPMYNSRCSWSMGHLILEALSNGTTKVQVKDKKTGKKSIVTVTVGGETPQEPQTEIITIPGTDVSFKMVAVEGGTFMMGAADDDSEANSSHKPAHEVTLSSFSIGETEVTQALWQAVMGSNPSLFTPEHGYAEYLQRPVETVSWNDCQTFIAKLNELTGKNFRLPTEAEWEYAARGGKSSQGYEYAGSNDSNTVAWYIDNSAAGGSDNPDYGTHAVATKLPNELGLYDMSGNVEEWCQDWYSDYSSEAQTNPTGPASGSDRVARGGSWRFHVIWCRVWHRIRYFPSAWNCVLGLRLAL